MKKRNMVLMILMMVSLSKLTFAQTADEVISKYVKASGMDKFSTISTMKQTGTVSIPQGELNFVRYTKRPNFIRTEIDAMGQQIVQLFDGTNSYSNNPFEGKTELQSGTEEQSANAKLQADFDPMLVNYIEKGSKAELIGKEKVDSVETYKLKLTTKSGNENVFYLNTRTYLPYRMTYKNTQNGAENNNDIRYLSYKNVNGTMIADKVLVMQDNSPMGKELTLKVTTVELNPFLEDAMFAAPETK